MSQKLHYTDFEMMLIKRRSSFVFYYFAKPTTTCISGDQFLMGVSGMPNTCIKLLKTYNVIFATLDSQLPDCITNVKMENNKMPYLFAVYS